MSFLFNLCLNVLAITSAILVLFSLATLPIGGQVNFTGMLIFSFLGSGAFFILVKLNPKQQIYKLLFAVNLLFFLMGLIILILASY